MATVRGSRLNNGTRPVLSTPAEPPTGARPAEQLTDRGSPESRRERHRREIFERLVEAARQLMSDRSLDDARVQDITDLADVGKGTFFNFFSAKELVIPEVMRKRVRPNRSMVEQVKAGLLSSREALNYFINSGLERLTPGEWHNYYESFIRSMVNDDRVRSSISDILREQEEMVRYLVASGQERGEFRDDGDTSNLANLLVRAILGLQMMAWIHGVGLNPDALEANARLTLDLLLCPPSPSAKARKVATPPIASSHRPKPARTGRKRRSRDGSA
jgi:AcrR family transcriptional regulator